MEKLVFIQNKTRIHLTIPSRDLTPADVNVTNDIFQKVKTGELVSSGDITIGVDRDSAKLVIETFKDAKALRVGPMEQSQEVFGVTIPLGPFVVTCPHAYIPLEDLDALEKTISTASPEETIHIRLRPVEGHFMVLQYTKWLPQEGGVSADLSSLAPPGSKPVRKRKAKSRRSHRRK